MKKLLTKKYLDIHDEDMPPEIYTLLWVLIEIKGNDLVYDFYTEELDEEDDESCIERMEKLWKEQLDRGSNNCYFDHEAMVEFIKNPCSYTEAFNSFRKWLKAKGLTKKDKEILIKMWW